MTNTLLRTNKEIVEIFKRHNKMLYRVCFSYLKNQADTEDIVQDTFYQMIISQKAFENSEHEKAWLIRTASNLCKNKLKHWWGKHEDLADYQDFKGSQNYKPDDTLEVVLQLPEKYKVVIYLYYYEGYNSEEIAKMLQKPQSTIRNHLSEARKILKEKIGDEFDEK